MKKYLILTGCLLFLLNFNINSEESRKGIYQNFSANLGFSINSSITFFTNANYGLSASVSSIVFFTLKFDYLFLKRINKNYKIGFGLAFGDSISVSGMEYYSPYGLPFTFITLGIFLTGLTPAFIYTMTLLYLYVNRLHQKISFANLIGNEEKNKFTLVEFGLNLEFVTFFYKYYSFDQKEMTTYAFFLSPYFFVGLWIITNSFYWERILKKSVELSYIVGGFLELSFDINPNKNFDHFFVNFGIECRIGHTSEKY